MWPLRKKTRQRRLDGRKAPAGGGTSWQRFTAAGGIFATAMATLLYVAAAAMDLLPVEPFAYRLGQYMPEDIHARVGFRIPVKELVEKASRRAELGTPAVFNYDPAAVEEITAALRKMPKKAPVASQPAPTTAPAAPPATAPSAPAMTVEDANMLSPWQQLAEDPNALKLYMENVDRLAATLEGVYIVQLKDAEEHKPTLRWPEKALLRGPKTAMPAASLELTVGELTDVAEAGEIDRTAARLALGFNEARRKTVEAYLRTALPAHPIYRYDRQQTQDLMTEAVNNVAANPPQDTYKEYSSGEPIATRSLRKGPDGEQAVGLTAEELKVLRAEHQQFVAALTARPYDYWSRIFGRAVIVLLVVIMLAAYVARYHGDLIGDRRTLVAFLAVLVLMLGANKVLVEILLLNPHVALLSAMMAGAMITLARNQRFALAVGVATAMLLVLQVRGSMELFLVLLAGMAAIIFRLAEVRTRTKLISSCAFAAGISLLAVLVTGLAAAKPWVFAIQDAIWAAGCGLMTGFVVQGALPLIESVFHIATSLTLLEWCDASRPLLKRLAVEAPGTYNHSLQLGSLCETAAGTIGARGLLARVGAYYHDIGKINKPDYFIENQAGSLSKHAKLSPAMSLLIIIGHVKDGLELAREYGLPKVLHEFIASHHGTTLVQYFYHAAAEQRREAADRPPEEAEFRYPGPKPKSKEPAILMLADAAESSVRAMSDPTPGRIEHQVHVMINRRLMDGQLDECELTLKEVHLIESSLVKSLCSMYHARIPYPTPANQKPAPGDIKIGERP
jgi:putative nucleotidyltransferase with HDIG domain